MDLEIYVKVLRQSVQDHLISKSLHRFYFTFWHDYRCWSKILFSTIPIPAYDLEVKVTDLEICVEVLRQVLRSVHF